jgi:Flp pilus assembly protein TadG
MSAANARAARCRPVRNAQSGVAAVEFAVVAAIVLMFMFRVMELARSMYMFNTLQEVTRWAATAAANAAFKDVAAMRG